LIQFLTDPFASQFMKNALAIAVIVGILCPVVGVWVVLRKLAYLGDAMSHASLSGVAIAYLIGASIVAGALAAGLIMGMMIAVLGARKLADDSVIGIVETILFALGVIIISRSSSISVDLTHFLFGQITTVSQSDVRLNAALAIIALCTVMVIFRDLISATFDPIHARQVGINVSLLRFLVLALVSICVVVSLQTVGLLMSVAMLVTPAASARLVTNRIGFMTFISVLIGMGAAVLGLIFSYHLSTPPGATIALTAAIAFLSIFIVTIPKRNRAIVIRAETRPIATNEGATYGI
jgi:ABC-type Mn2+/Zn2+ transport system permease subunit